MGLSVISNTEQGLRNGTVSVRLSYSPVAAACGGFAAVSPAVGDIGELLRGRCRSRMAHNKCG